MRPLQDSALEFVLAALRVGRGAAHDAVAEAYALDWERVVSLALQHDVPYWVERALPADAPRSAKEALGQARRPLALQALAGGRQLLELMRVLRAGNVRAVAYKGPALAAELHGDAAARRFTDLDVLIAQRDRHRAVDLLRAAGYRTADEGPDRTRRFYERWEGVTHLVRGAEELPIELHWRCQAPRYGAPQDPAPIVDAAIVGVLGGGDVLVPSPAHHAALLALHGMKHGWRSLLWIEDFAASLRDARFSWIEFDRVVREWQIARAAQTALHVVIMLDLATVPDARLTATSAAPVRLAQAAIAHVLGERGEDVGEPSSARYELQWIGGAAAQVRYLALAALLPTPQERRTLALPDALLPLAVPLRLVRLLTASMRGRA